MKIVTVIPFRKGLWKENLTYFSIKDIPNGSIVTISLRNKNMLGLVVFTEDVTDAKRNIKDMDFNLKKILSIKEGSIFKSEFLESVFLCSKYFVQNNSDGVTSLIPNILKEEYDRFAELIKNKLLKNEQNKEELSVRALDSRESLKLSLIKNEKLLFQAKLEERIDYYKILIRSNFAKKKSVFIVLPTKNDIDDWYGYLSKGIEQFTISIHGGYSAKKQMEKIENIIKEEHPILIIGTAPYLSIDRRDIETIILEHESGNGYKMIAKPYFDLRIFTEIFASKINAKFILADSLLRFESIARREIDGLGEVHPMSFRISFDGKIEILSRKNKFKVLMTETIAELKSALEQKEKVFIFSLRKGLATYTICRDCGETVSCDECSTPVVLHHSPDKKKRVFVCNRCGTSKNTKVKCVKCDSWNLVPLGIGIDTVYEELKKEKLDHIKILKLDKDTAKTAKGALKIITEYETGENTILIGTEIALFYMKNQIDTCIVASFDSLWSIPNFKMSEKIIQLILLMLSKTKNKLIIQTKNDKDSALLAIKNSNLLEFIRTELEDRKSMLYPPYSRFIKVTYLESNTDSSKTKENLSEIFKDYNPVFYSGFRKSSKDKNTVNMLIKADPKKWSLPILSASASIEEDLYRKLLSLNKISSNFRVLIDPENLL
ncbi:MAG: primosomal protein N'' [Candidatus Nomurabacteria bacterium GW2011_GWA2_40_9]|uniref:Primosomal protein N n=1 Tax=Candidatus Nomurabacteria bacterium GW2011_GWA2_40_9 TaxID=1618734 RepID=A0A0G0TYH2_9BACT|nr:MAG: primosomal protein N'' [Candidatus Nomurabacteria bacterium GW2011_GWA2_40_9]